MPEPLAGNDVGEVLKAGYENAPNPPPHWEELCDDLARGADDADDERGDRAGAGGDDDE